MNLGRLFQRLALYRASRRVPLWALVALSVGFYLLAGIGEAHAQTAPDMTACDSTTDMCTPETSYNLGIADADWEVSQSPTGTYVDVRCFTYGDPVAGTTGEWQCQKQHSGGGWANTGFPKWGAQCPSGSTFTYSGYTCAADGPTEAECLARPSEQNWLAPDAGANPVCSEGCVYEQSIGASGNEYSTTGANCSAGDFPEPTVDSDGDGVADADDAFPSDPNEHTDNDGDGVGSNADTNDDDPDNGKDSGVGDETDNVASGSGSCAAPPTCSGDAIQCEILHTNWKISCSGAVVAGSPEVCNGAYTCTGDTSQCAQIALLRKSACQGIGGPGDANANGVPDVLEAGVADVGGEGPSLGSVDGGALWGEVDQDGWLSGGTCPGLPPISSLAGFEAVSAKLCDHGSILAGLFLAAAMAGAAYIIGRAATGT